jgi:hypothetical protein
MDGGTASRYGGWLRIHWISSRRQRTRGGLPDWGLGGLLTTPHRKRLLYYETFHKASGLGWFFAYRYTWEQYLARRKKLNVLLLKVCNAEWSVLIKKDRRRGLAFGRTRSWTILNGPTIQAFAWSDYGNAQKPARWPFSSMDSSWVLLTRNTRVATILTTSVDSVYSAWDIKSLFPSRK